MDKQRHIFPKFRFYYFSPGKFSHASSLNLVNIIFSKYCYSVDKNQIYSQLPLCQQTIYSTPVVLHRGSLQPCFVLLLAPPAFCPLQLPSQRADQLSFCSLPPGIIYLYLLNFIRNSLFLTKKGVLSTSSFESLMENLCSPREQHEDCGKFLVSFWGFPLMSLFYSSLAPCVPFFPGQL